MTTRVFWVLFKVVTRVFNEVAMQLLHFCTFPYGNDRNILNIIRNEGFV